MTLEEIRQKYPQYAKLSDEELANRLYQAKYADKMDKKTFLEKVGYGVGAESLTMANKIVRVPGQIWDKIVGTPEFDYPSLEDPGMGEYLPEGQRGLFNPVNRALWSGDEGAMSEAVKRAWGADTRTDRSGYQYFDMPGKGPTYTEKPGLDLEDIAAGASKTLAYIAGPQKFNQAKGAFQTASPMATAGSEMVVNSMLQALGKSDVDPVEVGIAGGTAMLAEAIAPIIKRNWNRFKGLFQQADGAVAGRAIAKDLALPGWDELDDRTYEELVAQIRRNVSGDVRPEAKIAEAEFGMPLGMGQQTDDLGMWRREERLIETDPRMRQLANDQERILKENLDKYQADVGGRLGPRNQDELAETFTDALRRQSEARRGEVNRAYEQVDAQRGSVRSEAFPDLFERINNWAGKERITGTRARTKSYPGAHTAKEDMDAILADFRQLKAKGARFDAPYMELEETRRSLADAYQAAANPADRRKVKAMQKEFDSWMDDVFDQRLIDGSPDFLDAVKNARELNAKYKADFAERWMKNGSDKVGKFVELIADGAISGREATNFIFGASSVNKQVAVEFARRLKGKLPEEGWNAFRESAIEKLFMNQKTGDVQATARLLLNNLKSATMGQNRRLFEEILTPSEMNKLERITMMVQSLLPRSSLTRRLTGNSVTTNRMIGMITELSSVVPGLRWIPRILRAMDEGTTARRATGGLLIDSTVNPMVPGAAASTATSE